MNVEVFICAHTPMSLLAQEVLLVVEFQWVFWKGTC